MTKQIQYTAAVLAALLALTACSAAPGGSGESGTQGESQAEPQAAAPTAEGQADSADPLRAIDTVWSASVGETAAYAAINLNDSGVYVGTRIDFATGRQEVLCQKAGCTHSDESCPAFLWKMSENHCVATSTLLADGDALYWVVDGRYNESAGVYVDVSDSDGQNRRRLAEGEALVDLDGINVSWFAGDGALYALSQEQLIDAETDRFAGVQQTLYKISESGGVEEIGTTPLEPPKPGYSANCFWLKGCWQGKIVLWYQEGYEEPVPQGEYTEESMNAYYAECDAREAQADNSLYMMDSNGQLTEIGVTWKGGEAIDHLLCGDNFYMLKPDGGIRAIDLTSGQEKEYTFPLEGTITSLYRGYGNCLYVTDPASESSYLWNLETGEATPLEPTWYKDQVAPRTPTVVAAGDTMLLLVVGANYYTMNTVGPDGVPYSFETCNYVYGLIPAEDFYAGSQNWVTVTLLGRDLI